MSKPLDVATATLHVAELVDEPVSVAAVAPGGYSGTPKFRARGARSGRTWFVKAAATAEQRKALRHEEALYEVLDLPLLPVLVGVAADAALLVLEDLSAARWPPPWYGGDLVELVACLEHLHGLAPPEWLRPVDGAETGLLDGWALVAADPRPFLDLRLSTAADLDRWLPRFLEAEAAADLSGSSILHMDIRSDNVCRAGDGWRLVDWSWAALGPPDLDFVLWLPSVILELGSVPDELAAYAHHPWMVNFAGYLAARAGVPEPAGTSGVRRIQLAQLRVALPLAVEILWPRRG